MCFEIEAESSLDSRSANIVDVLTLCDASIYGRTGRRQHRLGLLIGRKGRHLSILQTKYNVHINIVTDTSSGHLQQRLRSLFQSHPFDWRQLHDRCNIHVVLTLSNASIETSNPIEEVKQLLQDRWRNIINSLTIT